MQNRSRIALLASETKISQSSGPMRDADGGYAPARTTAGRATGPSKGATTIDGVFGCRSCLQSRSYQTASSTPVSLFDSSQWGHKVTPITRTSPKQKYVASTVSSYKPLRCTRRSSRSSPHCFGTSSPRGFITVTNSPDNRIMLRALGDYLIVEDSLSMKLYN